MAQPPQINSVRTPDKAVVDATRSRRFPSLNLPLVVVVALLAGYGLVVVYSAVYATPTTASRARPPWWRRAPWS